MLEISHGGRGGDRRPSAGSGPWRAWRVCGCVARVCVRALRVSVEVVSDIGGRSTVQHAEPAVPIALERVERERQRVRAGVGSGCVCVRVRVGSTVVVSWARAMAIKPTPVNHCCLRGVLSRCLTK